jgi:hypothetical protein
MGGLEGNLLEFEVNLKSENSHMIDNHPSSHNLVKHGMYSKSDYSNHATHDE